MKTTLTQTNLYNLISRLPVLRCYYQGSHSHPIRRTMLIIQETEDSYVGYEFREGKKVRSIESAKKRVRTYKKDKIARWGDYSRLRMSSRGFMRSLDETTAVRETLSSVFEKGF